MQRADKIRERRKTEKKNKETIAKLKNTNAELNKIIAGVKNCRFKF